MALERIDYKTCKPGDRITVMVGGHLYDTIIDDNLTQRFIENPDHPLVKRVRTENPAGDVADLNEMALRYQVKKEFSKRDYAEMNMALGYSVCGFCDLSAFQDWDVDNPLWGELDEADPSTAVDVTVSISTAGREVLRQFAADYKDELNQSAYGAQSARDEVKLLLAQLSGETE